MREFPQGLAEGLAAVCLLAITGCGVSTVSVDDDPLTAQLGKSGVIVQQVSRALSPESLSKELHAADRTEVNRSNAVLEHLLRYEPMKVNPSDLDALIAHPNAAYRSALMFRAKLRRYQRDLTAAAIPADRVARSPNEVARFVTDWNRYVGYWRQVATAMRRAFDNGLTLRRPTLRFLRHVRAAILRRDGDAYRRSVASYSQTLQRLGRGLFDANGLPKVAGLEKSDSEQRLFNALIDDANGSEDVGRLVEALRKGYPKSLFAERFTR